MKIPHLTAPETKFIRTTEGVLIVALNVVVAVATLASHIVSGTHGIPVDTVTQWLGITDAITAVGRSGLKGMLALSQATGLTPLEPFDPAAVDDAEQLAESAIPEVQQIIDRASTPLQAPPDTAAKPDPAPPPPAPPPPAQA